MLFRLITASILKKAGLISKLPLPGNTTRLSSEMQERMKAHYLAKEQNEIKPNYSEKPETPIPELEDYSKQYTSNGLPKKTM